MAIKPSQLSRTLRALTAGLTHTHYQLVITAADFADSDEWARDGSPTPAHWLAAIADVETCTAREWIRVGRALRSLPASADAFANGKLSYAKMRALTRFANPDNETELLELALDTTANHLARVLAAWLNRTSDPADLEAHQHQQRSVTSRLEPDGITTWTLRLPPLQAGTLAAALGQIVMRTTPSREPLAQTATDRCQDRPVRPGGSDRGDPRYPPSGRGVPCAHDLSASTLRATCR
jgi:hypothetical protein